MGWFSSITKAIKKASTPWKSKDNLLTAVDPLGIGQTVVKGTENIYKGITGEQQAAAIAEAQAKAAEEARIARVRASQASQFASNDSDDQSGDVVLGTGEVDESLEEQLKRMRGK